MNIELSERFVGTGAVFLIAAFLLIMAGWKLYEDGLATRSMFLVGCWAATVAFVSFLISIWV